MTTPLAWPGCRNVRDLGGLPTVAGGQVQPRRLVRSDALDLLDDDGLRAFRGYGVARVLDLRGVIPGEPGPGDPVVHPQAVRIPWIDAARDHERDVAAELTLADTYRGTFERNTGQVAKIVRAFVDAPPGPVLVHCAAGKDRTGTTVALLLEVAGVPREHVVADYAASEVHLGILDVIAAHPDVEARDRLTTFSRTRPETMAVALEHLDECWGGAAGYLVEACGLTPRELTRVRARLVEPSAG